VLSHNDYQKALRVKALTLAVCTTGSTTLASTTTGYTRSAGSFVTDGFKVGMEVTASGFSSNNGTGVISAVGALSMSVTGYDVDTDGTVASRTFTAESAAAGRTIVVNMPALRAWENIKFVPHAEKPYVREQYLPGPTTQITLGATAQLEGLVTYVLQVFVPSNVGIGAASEYADALLTHFAPGTAITLSSGDYFAVRRDVAPFRGQLLQADSLHAVIPVTVPLRLRTTNSI
jgi:hypothetical protein